MKIEPNPQLEALLTEFSQQPGVTPDQAAQLRNAIASQADTLQRCNQEAANGHLQGFALESGEASLIGSFDKQSGIASLPAATFLTDAIKPITGESHDITWSAREPESRSCAVTCFML